VFVDAAAKARGVSSFDSARTELAWGGHLRRAGRRTDARGHLNAALAGFERLGAAAWAARTHDELRASGAQTRARDPGLMQRLTPRELEIALLAGAGATNREIGARLFLSARTVEVHLGRAYRKLGVRSRTELAGAIPSP
jgi:DNA-binding CsgD family transcriptional regulator